jgi:hypothetical protein
MTLAAPCNIPRCQCHQVFQPNDSNSVVQRGWATFSGLAVTDSHVAPYFATAHRQRSIATRTVLSVSRFRDPATKAASALDLLQLQGSTADALDFLRLRGTSSSLDLFSFSTLGALDYSGFKGTASALDLLQLQRHRWCPGPPASKNTAGAWTSSFKAVTGLTQLQRHRWCPGPINCLLLVAWTCSVPSPENGLPATHVRSPFMKP